MSKPLLVISQTLLWDEVPFGPWATYGYSALNTSPVPITATGTKRAKKRNRANLLIPFDFPVPFGLRILK